MILSVREKKNLLRAVSPASGRPRE